MDTAAGRSPLSSMLTSVLDLLFLMVICLLTLGGMLSALHRLEPEPAEAAAREPSLLELERTLDELRQRYDTRSDEMHKAARAAAAERQRQENVKRELESASQEQMRLELLIAALRKQVAELEEQVAAKRANEEALREMDELLGERDRGLRELGEERTRLVHQLDSLQSRLHDLRDRADKKNEQDKRGGVRWVRHDKQLDAYAVMLTGGAVFPFEPEFVEVERPIPTHQTYRPKGRGLTLAEAVKSGSPVMREVGTASFRKTRYVLLLVDADSFGTYRALRTHLRNRGVRVGWEPLLEPAVHVGPGGREAPGPQE